MAFLIKGKKLNKKLIIIFAILFVALFLRLFAAFTAEFGKDQLMYYQKTMAFVKQGALNPIGPGSYDRLGGLFGPAMWLLYSMPLSIHATPLAASIFLALISFSVIFLIYYLMTLLFSKRSAMIAASLYAVFPWPTILPVTIWEQPYLPLLYILFMIGLVKAIKQEKSPWIILPVIVMGIAFQLRIEAYALFIIFLAAIFLYRIKISFKYLTFSLLGVLLLYAPYIVYELNHGFENTIYFFTNKGSRFKPKMEVLKIFSWALVIGSVEGSNPVAKGSRVLKHYYHYFSITTVLIWIFYVLNFTALLAAVKNFLQTIYTTVKKSSLIQFFRNHHGLSLLFLVYGVQLIFQLILLYPVDYNYVYQFMPLTIILFAIWIDSSLLSGILSKIPKKIFSVIAVVYIASIVVIDMGILLYKYKNLDHVYNIELLASNLKKKAGKQSFSIQFRKAGFPLAIFTHLYKYKYACNFNYKINKLTRYLFIVTRVSPKLKNKNIVFKSGSYWITQKNLN